LMKQSLAAALARIDLFAALDDETRARLGPCLTEVRLGRGETLFREGEQGAAMYLVGRGEVRVLSHGATREVCRLGPGEHVGEMAVIDPCPRSATVVAACDTTVWRLTAQDFESVARGNSELHKLLAVSLARRLRATTAGDVARLSEAVVLVVDARGSARPGDRLIANLLAALEATAKQPAVAVTLAPADGPPLPGLSVLEPDELGARIDRLLADHAHVLLVMNDVPSDDDLLRAAMGRADLAVVLLSLQPASLESAGRLLDRFARLPVPQPPPLELGLDRRDELPRAPFGPVDELAAGRVVHTISRTPGYPTTGPPDFEGVGRLARRIARRRVGLALGGGGARAFAHIGVLGVFERAGIPVDVLAGTSAGAMMAGMAARDLDSAFMTEYLSSKWTRRGIVDWKLVPWVSLLRGRKLDRLGRDAAQDLTIQELSRPFVAVATDLVTGQEVRLGRGDGWTAVLASISIPGVFPPIRLGDSYLVDGGAINNLPAAAAREAGADIVIGVHLSPPLERAFLRQAGGEQPRGLFDRLRNSRRDGLPLLRIMYRTITVQGQALQARQGAPDLTLKPDVSAYDIFEFSGLASIIESGRVEGEQRLEEVRRVVRDPA
jgi:NTE family protein